MLRSLVICLLFMLVAVPVHAAVKTIGQGESMRLDPAGFPPDMKAAYAVMQTKCTQCHSLERTCRCRHDRGRPHFGPSLRPGCRLGLWSEDAPETECPDEQGRGEGGGGSPLPTLLITRKLQKTVTRIARSDEQPSTSRTGRSGTGEETATIMKNSRLSHRLITAFMFMALIVALSGAYGISTINRVSSKVQETMKSHASQEKMVIFMRVAMQESRNHLLESALVRYRPR